MKKAVFLQAAYVVIVALLYVPAAIGQGVQIEKAPGSQPLTSAAPSPHQAGSPAPSSTPTEAEALYDYLHKYNITVIKDESGSRLVWTDRALIEITDASVPEPLATLLSTAPTNNGQFATWVHDTFETQLDTWHAGKRNPHPSKSGTEELVSVRGKGRCFVNPVYLAYVLSRYPDAGILIKGPTDPVLFTVNGKLRAVVSPWTKLPDGTPLL